MPRDGWGGGVGLGGGGGGGGGAGTCFNFHSGRGGGPPPPWTPPPPSPDPFPPPPSAQVHPKTWVSGTFFSHGEKIIRRLRRMPYIVYILLHVCSISLVFQTTMPQRSFVSVISAPRSHRCHVQNGKTQLTRCSILGLKIASPVIKDKKPRYPLIQS